MSKIEAARENAMRQLSRAIPVKKGGDRPYYLCEKAIDAYALAAHVDACQREGPPPSYADMYFTPKCGDGWYCDKAKEIEELR